MDWEDLLTFFLPLARWRFQLCFWIGIILAVIANQAIPYDPLRRIVAGIIFVMGVIIGLRWDTDRYR